MESIFYAAIALHIAGKPISKENIRAVLQAAGTPVNEPALEAMEAFVETLETSRKENKEPFDPRLIKLLTSELAHHEVQTGQVEALLAQLTRSDSTAAEVNKAIPAVLSEATSLEEIAGEGTKSTTEMLAKVGAVTKSKGRYIYGIAAGDGTMELGPIGIEDTQVYIIPYRDICAIVHNCPAEPYESSDDGIVKAWVKAHQRVLDEVKRRFGTVIPLGFDTIIRPKDGATDPDKVVKDWLVKDYDRLITIMEKIKGADEYGVQIFYDSNVISIQISKQSEEVRQIKEEMATKSSGMAYMCRQKLERAVKSEIEELADEWFKDFYVKIKRHSADVVVEKTKKAGKERVMLLNLSCLVAKENVGNLGEELEKISNAEGFSVRFSGPWPPYSFVANPMVSTIGE